MKQDYTIPRNLLDGVEAFLRVADRKSFRLAADDLGVSPSAISQTVRQLEERIGLPLFIRTTRSVGLTEAGSLFHARRQPGTKMRINFATAQDAAFWRDFESERDAMRR